MSSSIINNHDYPGYATLGDVFNISAAAPFEVSNATIVATSGQIGEAADYSPFQPSGANNEQFSGGHAAQFELALKNIEKSLSAAQPHLSPQGLWEGLFNITSYHVGVVPQKDQLEIAAVARRYLGSNNPAWAAICVAALFPPSALWRCRFKQHIERLIEYKTFWVIETGPSKSLSLKLQ